MPVTIPSTSANCKQTKSWLLLIVGVLDFVGGLYFVGIREAVFKYIAEFCFILTSSEVLSKSLWWLAEWPVKAFRCLWEAKSGGLHDMIEDVSSFQKAGREQRLETIGLSRGKGEEGWVFPTLKKPYSVSATKPMGIVEIKQPAMGMKLQRNTNMDKRPSPGSCRPHMPSAVNAVFAAAILAYNSLSQPCLCFYSTFRPPLLVSN